MRNPSHQRRNLGKRDKIWLRCKSKPLQFLIIHIALFMILEYGFLVIVASEESVTVEEKNNDIIISSDTVADSIYDVSATDPDCASANGGSSDQCNQPPASTMEETIVEKEIYFDDEDDLEICEEDDGLCGHITSAADHPSAGTEGEKSAYLAEISNSYGGKDPDDEEIQPKKRKRKIQRVEKQRLDKHWGSDEKILDLRDALREAGLKGATDGKRPPVFLMPGLASTRLVAWSGYQCKGMGSDINIQDYVWLNINKILELATIDGDCWISCMSLAENQTDVGKEHKGCKLRPDEGLDAISSLAPGSLSTNMLVGGTNTVYAWLTHWLAENLGYDVTSMLGLPYDWRLSPDVMESRDGFFSLTRKRIEATVASNGAPGIIVAHSMGNTVFRIFLDWLRHLLKQEAYDRYLKTRKNQRSTKHQKKDIYYEQFLSGWVPKKYNKDLHGGNDKDTSTNEKNNNDNLNKDTVISHLDDWWQKYVLGHPDENDDTNNEQKKNMQPSDYSSMIDNGKTIDQMDDETKQLEILWELAEVEGDLAWLDWLETHIWTYVGLSAPLLGAFGPLRSVLSGENMGLPMSDEMARKLELSFGSTNTVNSISTKTGFCDDQSTPTVSHHGKKLACLDELVSEIEKDGDDNIWEDFDALRLILKERVDFDSSFPNVQVVREFCEKSEKSPCSKNETIGFGPKDIQSGLIFDEFDRIWKEKGRPLKIKREQLEHSYWNTPYPNVLNQTWDRPPIKHIILAYGVDVPTEIGYVYKKTELSPDDKVDKKRKSSDEIYDGIPMISSTIWETESGKTMIESLRGSRPRSLIRSTKPKMVPFERDEGGQLPHSGDGTIPYLSLAWAHTWLLHATRAMKHSNDLGRSENDNILDSIKFSFRPNGGSYWISGKLKKILNKFDQEKNSVSDSDTGTSHPHGTKYKPEMRRFQSKGKSRTTGMDYTTTVIEAIGVEHKETTRNYDILAAVFTDILKYMSDDFDFAENSS